MRLSSAWIAAAFLSLALSIPSAHSQVTVLGECHIGCGANCSFNDNETGCFHSYTSVPGGTHQTLECDGITYHGVLNGRLVTEFCNPY